MKYGKFIVSIDPRYTEQQEFLDEVAKELGVVAYRPDYHADKRDCNTVLFYTKPDAEWNQMVDLKETRYTMAEAEDLNHRWNGVEIPADCVYRNYFWSFENTDVNGYEDYQFANRGRIDLRGRDWKERLEGHIWLALARKNIREHVRSAGGWFGIREADDELNDMNRDIICALRDAYGQAYMGNINYYDEQRKRIVEGKESVFEEYTGQTVYTATVDFVVPVADEKLEELIREWNRKYGPGLVDKIVSRVERIGGELLIWS